MRKASEPRDKRREKGTKRRKSSFFTSSFLSLHFVAGSGSGKKSKEREKVRAPGLVQQEALYAPPCVARAATWRGPWLCSRLVRPAWSAAPAALRAGLAGRRGPRSGNGAKAARTGQRSIGAKRQRRQSTSIRAKEREGTDDKNMQV